MVKYSLILQIQDSKESYKYEVELSLNAENRPEGFFTREFREQMRLDLQRQSLRRINDIALNYIVKEWMKDIKEGYRNSTITLDLPPLADADLGNLADSGNQEIPPILYPDIASIEPLGGALPPLNFL